MMIWFLSIAIYSLRLPRARRVSGWSFTQLPSSFDLFCWPYFGRYQANALLARRQSAYRSQMHLLPQIVLDRWMPSWVEMWMVWHGGKDINMYPNYYRVKFMAVIPPPTPVYYFRLSLQQMEQVHGKFNSSSTTTWKTNFFNLLG